MKHRFEYLKTLLPFLLVVAVPVAVVGSLVMHTVTPEWRGILRRPKRKRIR